MNKSMLNIRKLFHFVFGVGLLISFFIPWVSWKEIMVKGYYLPSGRFFSLSSEHFHFENPFPQFSTGLMLFWLIPVLTALMLVFILLKKKTVPFAYITGALSLASITVFILFSQTLTDLGVDRYLYNMIKPGLYIQLICSIGLIITAYPVKTLFPTFIWLLLGPVIAYGSYKLAEKYVMAETFTTTDEVKADYEVNAPDLIRDFTTNDNAANEKYRDKIIIVNGNVSKVEQSGDSTTIIHFGDSTGSYIAFSLDKDQLLLVKNIKSGDSISLKGSCSGSIFSQILGTTSVSFKRSTLNKQKQP